MARNPRVKSIKRPKGAPFYGSPSHRILLFTRFYKREINFIDILALNSVDFKYFADIKREILKLQLAGFITFKEDTKSWKITSSGIQYLYNLAEQKAAIDKKIKYEKGIVEHKKAKNNGL